MKPIEEKKSNKKWFILAAAILLIGVGVYIGVKYVTKDKSDFYKTADKVFATEVGEYNYQFTVKQSDTAKTQEPDVTVQVTDDADAYASLTAVNEDWGTKDINSYDWSKKEYKVEISGLTKSVEPFYGSMSVKISTGYINAVFTDIIIKDGSYYINVKEMKSWLESCGDDSMVALSEMLPYGYDYIEVLSDSENGFVLSSAFAEDSEKSTSGVTDVSVLTKRFSVLEQIVTSVMRKAIGESVLSSEENFYSLKIDDSEMFRNAVKNSLGSVGNYYSTYVEALGKRSLATEAQVTQLNAEKDNFVDTLSGYWQEINVSATAFKEPTLAGSARSYQNSQGIKVYEVSADLTYKSDLITTNITMFCSKTLLPSEAITIKEPTAVLPYDAQTVADVYYVFGEVFYLFDITGFSLDNSLKFTLDSLSTEMKEAYVDYINSETNSYEGYLAIKASDLEGFIAKYSNMDVSVAGDLDKKKAECALTILSEINEITGNTVITEILVTETAQTKFSEVRVDGETYNAFIYANEAESEDGLLVLDVLFLNKLDTELTINLTKFYIIDADGNKIAANNYTLLHDYDSKYKKTSFDKEVVIGENEYIRTKIYITLPAGYSSMKLFDKDVELGIVCNY